MTESNVLSKCGLTVSLRLWGPSTDCLVLCVGKGVGWSHLHALLTCFHCYIIVTSLLHHCYITVISLLRVGKGVGW